MSPTTRGFSSSRPRPTYFHPNADMEDSLPEELSPSPALSPLQSIGAAVGKRKSSFIESRPSASNSPTLLLRTTNPATRMPKSRVSKASTSGHSGSLALSQPKSDRHKTPFRFQDLPPETRNKIYRLALTDNTPIEITNERLEFRSGLSRDKKARVGRSRIDESLVVLLLTADQSVKREATGVLYGGNRFLFADFKVLEQFLQLIGCDNRRYLTKITINGEFQKLEARSAGSMLMDAKHLKNIHFGPWKCKFDTFKQNVWDCLKPVFVTVYRANKNFDSDIDAMSLEKAVSVVSFDRETCYLDTSSADTAAGGSRSNAKTIKGGSKVKDTPNDVWLKSDRYNAQEIWKNKLKNSVLAPNYIKSKGDRWPGH